MSDLASRMEDQDEGELEFREEELVDFEGSDYSIGYDNEFSYEEEVGGPSSSTKSEDILLEQIEHNEQSKRKIASLTFPGDHMNSAVCYTIEGPEFEVGDSQPKHLDDYHRQDVAESEEIEEGKYLKEDFSVSQTGSSFDTNILDNKGCQVGAKKHLRADLEDGELDDTAMVIPCSYSPVFLLHSTFFIASCLSIEKSCQSKLTTHFCILRSFLQSLPAV